MSDEFANALQSDAYKEWKGETVDKPVETPTPDAAPATDAAPVDQAQARGPDGKFVAKPPEQPQESEPFEGFSKLDASSQAHFRRLLGERDDYRLRYTRQIGEYKRVLKQQNGSGRNAQPEYHPSSGNAQAGMQDARQQVSGLPAGQQRDALNRQLDKWDAHSKAYPEDAAAIQQFVEKFAHDMRSGIDPLAQEVQHLRAQFEELSDFTRGMQNERAERHAQEAQSVLDKEAGDNWRQIAGWEDEHGHPIPPEKRTWHPEFVAWVEGHDPDMQEYLWQTLNHPSPRVTAKVFAEFNHDRFGLEAGQATPTSQATQRRAEALRDIQPNTGSAKPNGTASFTPTGDAYADAVRSEAYAAWLKA